MSVSRSDFITAIFDGMDPEREAVAYARLKHYPSGQQAMLTRDIPWPDPPEEDYFCVSTVKPPASKRAHKVSRARGDLVACWMIYADDVGSKVPMPPVEPSYLMETSAGNFQAGYFIEPTEDIEYFARCQRAMADAGYCDPGVKDPNRVLRLPGSVNEKPGKGRFVSRVVDWHPERFWALTRLMAELGLEPAEGGPEPLTPMTLPDGVELSDPVATWLYEQKLVSSADAERGWLFLVCPWWEQHEGDARIEAKYSPFGQGEYPQIRGFHCFHSHGGVKHTSADFLRWVAERGGPECKVSDPEAIIEAARGAGGGGGDDGEGGGGEGDADDDDGEGLPEWMLEGRRIDAMPTRTQADRRLQLSQRLVYVGYEDRYYYTNTRQIFGLKPSALPLRFNEMQDTLTPAGRPTRKPLGELVKPLVQTVDRLDFQPGEGMRISDGDTTLLNSYRPPFHPPGEAETRLFDQLLMRIANDPDERRWVLERIAHKIQHPEIRGPGILSLSQQENYGPDGDQQVQGTGRGTLTRLLRLLHGEQYVTEVSFDALTGGNYQAQYTDWMHETVWAIVSEAKDSTPEHIYRRAAKVSAYERVKEIIEPGACRRQIVRKGLPNTDQNVYTSVLIATNHADALRIPRGDRRIFCCRSGPKVGEAFWIAIHKALEDPKFIAALYWRLRSTPITIFNPYAPVYETNTKRLLFATFEDDIDNAVCLFSMWAPGEMIDIARFEVLWRQFRQAHSDYDDVPAFAVKEALRKLPMAPLRGSGTVKVKGKNCRPRILRNFDEWRLKQKLEKYPMLVRKECEKNLPMDSPPLSVVPPMPKPDEDGEGGED